MKVYEITLICYNNNVIYSNYEMCKYHDEMSYRYIDNIESFIKNSDYLQEKYITFTEEGFMTISRSNPYQLTYYIDITRTFDKWWMDDIRMLQKYILTEERNNLIKKILNDK